MYVHTVLQTCRKLQYDVQMCMQMICMIHMLLGDLKLPSRDKMSTSPTVVYTGTPKEGTRYTQAENVTTLSETQYSGSECPHSESEA